MTYASSTYKNWLFPLIAVFLAIALQVQVTLFNSENYLGLRISLADFALPFLGLFILFDLLKKSSRWPAWDKPFGYWAIGLLGVVVLGATMNGYALMEQWSSWAWINKCLGWFILMAYMATGGWLATNAPPRALKIFSLGFIAFFCLVTIIELTLHFLYLELDINLFSDKYYPHLKGLMHNRNALAFLFLCIALLAAEATFKQVNTGKLHTTIFKLFWFLVPFFILMNGSRTLWLAVIPLFIFLGLRHKNTCLKTILLPLVCGAIMLPVAFQDTAARLTRPVLHTTLLIKDAERSEIHKKHRINKKYDKSRLKALNDGIELIKHRPLTGSGLGGFLKYQKEKYGETLTVMDNTLLWILIEMGAIGLFSFILVYIVMLHTLYKRPKEENDHTYISKAALFMLVAFGFFSLFHEILYSRFLWFILGIALVTPIVRQDSQESVEQAKS